MHTRRKELLDIFCCRFEQIIPYLEGLQITGCFVIRVNNEFPPSTAAFKTSFTLCVPFQICLRVSCCFNCLRGLRQYPKALLAEIPTTPSRNSTLQVPMASASFCMLRRRVMWTSSISARRCSGSGSPPHHPLQENERAEARQWLSVSCFLLSMARSASSRAKSQDCDTPTPSASVSTHEANCWRRSLLSATATCRTTKASIGQSSSEVPASPGHMMSISQP